MDTEKCQQIFPASRVLDGLYPEMRWRILSLAADFDRLQRSAGGDALLRNDARIAELRQCIKLLLDDDPDRAARVQLTLSEAERRPPAGRS